MWNEKIETMSREEKKKLQSERLVWQVKRMYENVELFKNRMDEMGLLADGFHLHEYPTTFWDVYGEKGMPLRTTITEMGPLLLSRIMDLNDTQ